MICRTADEAFEAGLAEPCEHDQPPALCPDCQLSGAEIARLLVLHREHFAEAPAAPRLRAA
ncbi:hypothetical protein [Streptomyces sp. NPDC059071]|uniref:hypothetical protein n=1 Tax=unclassified Streptomyces TaxID=2593676 RepID=UPI003655210D